jgi:tetratricopeptide (TPR) repeat protein
MTLSLDPALQQEIESVIAALDAARKSGQPAHTQAAMQECDRVIAALGEPLPATASPAAEGVGGAVERALDPKAGARSTLWLKRGHLLEAIGTGEAAGQALESYGRAIAALEGEPGTGPKMGRAIAWMNRGNVLQRFRDERAWSDAVRCYDQAVGWLGSLSEKGQVNAELASALGAAWMNRGAALRQFGKPERWTEALKSFEQALGLFQQLATSSAAAMPNVITAWEARGEAKLALGEPAEAVRSHEEALGTLRSWNERTGQALEPWDFGRIIFKLGQARAQAGDADGALRELREVLKLVAADERDEVPAAVLGLQGRHAVGVILGARLAADGASAGAADLRAEAGDLAEDGLAIAAIWAGRGEEGLIGGPGLGLRLFEFGAWLYRTQQPQFLAEFLSEHAGDPQGPRAQLALQVLAQTRQDILKRPLPNLSAAEINRTQAMLEGLRAIETKLGQGTQARAAG